MNKDDVCSTCQRTRGWHDENLNVIHTFTMEGQRSSLGERRQKAQDAPRASASSAPAVMRWPFDPVLRQALVDKGVLTIQDLEQAEQKIRSASVILGQPPS